MAASTPNRARVLVVDDEPNILEVISMALRYHGFDVEVAENGQRALAAVSAFHPDLMLLDIMLPDMEGFEVARGCAHSAPTFRSCSSPRATPPRTRCAV